MFTDYYEIMEISPNANPETIDRIFRFLAMRYHPDNKDTADRSRFDKIVEAHNTLKEPVTRAQYDVEYKTHCDLRWKLAEEFSDGKGIARDIAIQHKILSILYIRRRQSISDPGIGNHTLEQLLRCPPEHLEFHLWYLKEKGWIARLENGMLAITVAGVDHINSEQHRKTTTLLTIANQTR